MGVGVGQGGWEGGVVVVVLVVVVVVVVVLVVGGKGEEGSGGGSDMTITNVYLSIHPHACTELVPGHLGVNSRRPRHPGPQRPDGRRPKIAAKSGNPPLRRAHPPLSMNCTEAPPALRLLELGAA